MKGAELDQEYLDEANKKEAEWCLAFYGVSLETSFGHKRHGASVSNEELYSRTQTGETAMATRFISENAHMMCRERVIATCVEQMNRPETIAEGHFEATISLGEPIGVGFVANSASSPKTVRWTEEISTATFEFDYDAESELWFETNGYPSTVLGAEGDYETNSNQQGADTEQSLADVSIPNVRSRKSFRTLLREKVGDPPVGMPDPHAHHILYRKGLGSGQQALVLVGQAILEKHGIDPVYGVENLVWAPMRVVGQHGIEALQNVLDTLTKVDAYGGDYDDIVDALRELGRIAASRK